MAYICIPKEVKTDEFRVSLTPQAAEELVKLNHRVFVETNAGLESGYPDDAYRKAGAQISILNEIWFQNSLVVKVKDIQPQEYISIKPDTTIFLFAHFNSHRYQKFFFELGQARRITAIPYEKIRICETSPILKEMSICTGELAAYIGCEYLRKDRGGPGILPSEARAVIIGAGSAGLKATEILSLFVREINLYDLKLKKNIFWNKVYYHKSTKDNLAKILPEADIVICAAVTESGAPKIIDEELSRLVKPSAIIIDIAIDEGGNFFYYEPTSPRNPIFTYGCSKTRVYAVPNIPGMIPKSSTPRLSQAILPFVKIAADLIDKGERNQITPERLADEFIKNKK